MVSKSEVSEDSGLGLGAESCLDLGLGLGLY